MGSPTDLATSSWSPLCDEVSESELHPLDAPAFLLQSACSDPLLHHSLLVSSRLFSSLLFSSRLFSSRLHLPPHLFIHRSSASRGPLGKKRSSRSRGTYNNRQALSPLPPIHLIGHSYLEPRSYFIRLSSLLPLSFHMSSAHLLLPLLLYFLSSSITHVFAVRTSVEPADRRAICSDVR